jgi:hypothetical protein
MAHLDQNIFVEHSNQGVIFDNQNARCVLWGFIVGSFNHVTAPFRAACLGIFLTANNLIGRTNPLGSLGIYAAHRSQ